MIYAQTKNGVTTYNYTTPIAGNPHNIKLGRIQVPSGTKKVAAIHTRPKGITFSDADIANAERRGINAFVVGPNLKLQKYNVISHKTSSLGRVYPIALTSWQKEALLSEFQISWDSHSETCDRRDCSPGDFPGR